LYQPESRGHIYNLADIVQQSPQTARVVIAIGLLEKTLKHIIM
jgi:hypothetical protein